MSWRRSAAGDRQDRRGDLARTVAHQVVPSRPNDTAGSAHARPRHAPPRPRRQRARVRPRRRRRAAPRSGARPPRGRGRVVREHRRTLASRACGGSPARRGRRGSPRPSPGRPAPGRRPRSTGRTRAVAQERRHRAHHLGRLVEPRRNSSTSTPVAGLERFPAAVDEHEPAHDRPSSTAARAATIAPNP